MKTKLGINSLILLLTFSCKTSDEKQAETKAFPESQPLNYEIEPTLSCDTAPSEPSITINHPLTGEEYVIEYKNSDQIDYLTRDWESRIPYSKDFFSKENMGGYAPNEMRTTVIDIRNVNGKPSYHYFSNGTAFDTLENLSATKFMAATFSIHKIRQVTKGAEGADIRFNTRVLASDFDVIGKKSDNNYAAGVKLLGGTRHANKMLENWLMTGERNPVVTGSNKDIFNGTWGAGRDYCGDSYSFPAKEIESLTTGKKYKLPEQKRDHKDARTHISGLTFAEWLKRIAVNYRDPNTLPKLINYDVNRWLLPSKETRKSAKPSLTKRDFQLLMYGTAAYSDKEFKDRGLTGSDCGGPLGGSFSTFNGYPRGGLMWDGLRDWPHNAGGVKRLDALFGKRWRMLGKGGSSGVSNREAAVGYMCLPKIEKDGKILFPGREMVVYLHFKNRYRPGVNFTHVHNAAKAIINEMIPGLNGSRGIGEIASAPREEILQNMMEICKISLPVNTFDPSFSTTSHVLSQAMDIHTGMNNKNRMKLPFLNYLYRL